MVVRRGRVLTKYEVWINAAVAALNAIIITKGDRYIEPAERELIVKDAFDWAGEVTRAAGTLKIPPG